MNNSVNGRGGGSNWKTGWRGGGLGDVEAEPTGEAQEEARLGGEAGEVYSDSCREVSLIAAAAKHRNLADRELLEKQFLKDENLKRSMVRVDGEESGARMWHIRARHASLPIYHPAIQEQKYFP